MSVATSPTQTAVPGIRLQGNPQSRKAYNGLSRSAVRLFTSKTVDGEKFKIVNVLPHPDELPDIWFDHCNDLAWILDLRKIPKHWQDGIPTEDQIRRFLHFEWCKGQLYPDRVYEAWGFKIPDGRIGLGTESLLKVRPGPGGNIHLKRSRRVAFNQVPKTPPKPLIPIVAPQPKPKPKSTAPARELRSVIDALTEAKERSRHIVVLDSALQSARKVKRFQRIDELDRLLAKLTDECLPALLDGQPLHEAFKAFGSGSATKFANTESAYLTPKGKKRRTFSFDGMELFMKRHLKIGVGQAATDSLRVHFEWLAKQRKLVIGYAGAHLDW